VSRTEWLVYPHVMGLVHRLVHEPAAEAQRAYFSFALHILHTIATETLADGRKGVFASPWQSVAVAVCPRDGLALDVSPRVYVVVVAINPCVSP
jgi:hypothetical protein